MADTKLTITAAAQGTEQTAAELQKVADAQRQVGEQVKGGGKAAEETKPKFEGLSASTEDYVGVLRKIHPALGEYAQTLVRGAKVAGSLRKRTLPWAT